MAEPHVVSALIDKYRRVAGELASLGRVAQALRSDLAHLEAAIRIFKSDCDPSELPPILPRRPNVVFGHGELARMAYDILRDAPDPMTSREIVAIAMERKGMVEPEERVLRGIVNSLNGCMENRVKAGTVVRHDGLGPRRWSIKA